MGKTFGWFAPLAVTVWLALALLLPGWRENSSGLGLGPGAGERTWAFLQRTEQALLRP